MCCCNTKDTALQPVTSSGRQPSWSRSMGSAPDWSSSSTMSKNSQAAANREIDKYENKVTWRQRDTRLQQEGQVLRNKESWTLRTLTAAGGIRLRNENGVNPVDLRVLGKSNSLFFCLPRSKQTKDTFKLWGFWILFWRIDEGKEQAECLNIYCD